MVFYLQLISNTFRMERIKVGYKRMNPAPWKNSHFLRGGRRGFRDDLRFSGKNTIPFRLRKILLIYKNQIISTITISDRMPVHLHLNARYRGYLRCCPYLNAHRFRGRHWPTFFADDAALETLGIIRGVPSYLAFLHFAIKYIFL